MSEFRRARPTLVSITCSRAREFGGQRFHSAFMVTLCKGGSRHVGSHSHVSDSDCALAVPALGILPYDILAGDSVAFNCAIAA